MKNKDERNLQNTEMHSENKMTLQKIKGELRMSPKGTNITGHYRECEEGNCLRFIPCPHVRCQKHRTDMAIKDWTVQHIE